MDTATLYQNTPNHLTRRSFIRKAAATGAFIAAPQVVPSSVFGREGHTAPSERITVGFIGIGVHGFNWNLPPYLAHKDTRIVATCDVGRQRRRRASPTHSRSPNRTLAPSGRRSAAKTPHAHQP